MPTIKRWTTVALIVAGLVLALAGCADVSSDSASEGDPSATLTEVPGTDVKQVTLTEKAAQRLDIQMQPIVDQGGAQVVPYASVVYDANGATWIYTSPAPFTFQRAPITVAGIVGDGAILAAGPGLGTQVVTVGTAELFGTENEIGH
jgi:hypothetical protein